MRIVEVESENDESGSDEASDDDEDDDGGMESESEDKDEGAGANNGPIIYNCIEYDSDNDDDYPLDKIHMVNASTRAEFRTMSVISNPTRWKKSSRLSLSSKRIPAYGSAPCPTASLATTKTRTSSGSWPGRRSACLTSTESALPTFDRSCVPYFAAPPSFEILPTRSSCSSS